MQLVLASSSPYRKQMLGRLRIPFIAVAPDVDESPQPGETPADLALRLSRAKAHAVAMGNPGAVVIGSDQVASLNGSPLGKPGTFERARTQLQQLRGQTVWFNSAICVTDGAREECVNVVTRCSFRELSDAEIEAYLHMEKPFDTAGSAKAEGLGITLMDAMHSDDPTAIIGLPLIALSRILRGFDFNPLLDYR